MFPETSLPLKQIAEEMAFSDEALEAIGQAGSSSQALQILLSEGHGREALALVARCLPKRFVVVWICQCVRNHPHAQVEAQMADLAAVSLAERWLRQASEDNRRAAADYADRGGYRSLGDWLTASVGWSDGSLTPPDSPAVAPADHLCALAAVATLLMLAARQPEQMLKRQRGFVSLANEMFG